MNLPLLRVMFLGPIDVQEEDQTNLTFLNQKFLKRRQANHVPIFSISYQLQV